MPAILGIVALKCFDLEKSYKKSGKRKRATRKNAQGSFRIRSPGIAFP
jgi:hypothetical protein